MTDWQDYRPTPTFAFADVEHWIALSLRKGWPIARVMEPQDVRAIAGVMVIDCLGRHPKEFVQKKLRRFFAQEGAWLQGSVKEALSFLQRENYLREKRASYVIAMDVTGHINRLRILDRMRVAQEILDRKRQEVRAQLQAKNRAQQRVRVVYSAQRDQKWMQVALRQARLAAQKGEIPIGAVLVGENTCISVGHNETRTTNDPTAHAEVVVLRRAGQQLQNYRFPQTTLYVTVEPCPMCAGALLQARVSRIVFGVAEPKMGALGSTLSLFEKIPLHRPNITRGVCQRRARQIMQDFFAQRRARQKRNRE